MTIWRKYCSIILFTINNKSVKKQFTDFNNPQKIYGMKKCREKIPYIFLLSIFFLVLTGTALRPNSSFENSLNETDSNYIEYIAEEATLAQAPAANKAADVDAKDKAKETDAKTTEDGKRTLKPLVIKGTREKKKKDIQSVSRQTMTVEEIKEVPGSFGDSVRALTSLPGINSAFGGFFGPLVIRGANPSSNNYLVDDVPVDNPLHFGGLHCVINTNLIKDIDVYSSAFPAQFGSATAAIININTIDEVNEFGGYTNLSLLTADALVRTPILTDKFGRLITDTPSHLEKEEGVENRGYFIVSGRYGYITLAIKAAELISGKEVPISPEYWDYQVKSKYKIDNTNSIILLLFGHKDYVRILLKGKMNEEGDDPLLSDIQFQTDITSHNQGLYLESKFSSEFINKLIYYSSLPDTHTYLNVGSAGAASWAKDINVHSRPWVFGLKDKVKVKWMNGHSELSGGPEYTLYYFNVYGRAPRILMREPGFNIGSNEAMETIYIDKTIINHKIGGYLENRFTYGGYTFTPGFRSEYLARTSQTTYDPRGMMSYKFSTDTTISAAGGHYSNFFQTNPFYFNQITDSDLPTIKNRITKPEKAWHAAIGAEQEVGLFTFKLEGFSNYFYNIWEDYYHTEPDGSKLNGFSSGKAKARGFEIMIRKDTREKEDGLYGWLSYTYTQSKYKSGLPTEDGLYGLSDNKAGDKYGDTWITSRFELLHAVKLVAGYIFGEHIVSTKIQYYSGSPYTPIIGHRDDLPEPDTYGRYTPAYGKTNSKNFPPYWQIDLRYTRKIPYSWGNISWYVEVINIFSAGDYEYKWYWNRDYSSGSNPEVRKRKDALPFFPNFGVEVRF
jgi:hypothetical protein